MVMNMALRLLSLYIAKTVRTCGRVAACTLKEKTRSGKSCTYVKGTKKMGTRPFFARGLNDEMEAVTRYQMAPIRYWIKVSKRKIHFTALFK